MPTRFVDILKPLMCCDRRQKHKRRYFIISVLVQHSSKRVVAVNFSHWQFPVFERYTYVQFLRARPYKKL